MIPFGSQRGSGQDLAFHLMNGEDNEYVEILALRGAIADDLPGAIAEWEVQAKSMTRCEQYLYSLSVNPDPNQPPWPDSWIFDYKGMVDKALRLEGQPYVIVKHIKEDKLGRPRDHYHIVTSRIDVQEMKAIHMAFDHDKLMAVTRQFAREKGIELAPGYFKQEERQLQTYRQKTLYEKAQEDRGGPSREERTALVTELWHGRDTAESFVKALEYHGYILATGDKRPYVLVDVYGHMNSLPKLIDDKKANTKAIRAFLGEDAELPSIEEARAEAKRHRKALEDFRKAERLAEERKKLEVRQAARREEVERKIADQRDRHDRDRDHLEQRLKSERSDLRAAYLEERRAVNTQREENRPTGLAGFLSRVSGMDLVRERMHRYQDAKRYAAYRTEREEVRVRQLGEREELQRSQEMQALDLERERRNLDRLDKREQDALARKELKAERIRVRDRAVQSPEPAFGLNPPGRRAVPHRAKNRFQSAGPDERRSKKRNWGERPQADERLQDTFARAAGNPQDRDGQDGDGGEDIRARQADAKYARTVQGRKNLGSAGMMDVPTKFADPLPRIDHEEHGPEKPVEPDTPPPPLDDDFRAAPMWDRPLPVPETVSPEVQQDFARAARAEPEEDRTTISSSDDWSAGNLLPDQDQPAVPNEQNPVQVVLDSFSNAAQPSAEPTPNASEPLPGPEQSAPEITPEPPEKDRGQER